MTGGDLFNAGALAEKGLLATTDAVASVTELLGVPGSRDPERLLRVRLMRGFDFDVLPGRGFDIGAASFRGVPISWFSPVRDARALPTPRGTEWLERFTGGLLATCGLYNVGPETRSAGLHGDLGHRPARDISWRRTVDRSRSAVELRAAVDSVQLFGDSFQLDRRIVSSLGADDVAELRIIDTVTNVGLSPAAVHALYHLNLGAPLVAPGTSVRVAAHRWMRREDPSDPFEPSVLPEVSRSPEESVFEHVGVHADAAGEGSVEVVNEDLGLSATVSWSLATLPRLFQWVLPTQGRWALGIEPANAPLFGPDRSGPTDGAPVLEAGASVQHEVTIRVTERSVVESATSQG
jgi:hypothetical protein